MKKLLFLLIAIFPAINAWSADAPAPVPPPTTAPVSVAPPTPASTAIVIKNKSSFKMEGGRNPFWPIGWKPSGLTTNPEAAGGGSDIPSTSFVLTSIAMEKGARFAIINGKVIQEGQQFALQVGTATYQLTLKAIQDGRVILGRRDQEIVVPLRRK